MNNIKKKICNKKRKNLVNQTNKKTPNSLKEYMPTKNLKDRRQTYK
jgi:hypothetical protein